MTGRLRVLPVLGIAALTGVLLVPLLPRYFYHWDEIQLQLGVRSFDLAHHQPHPPGYYLYILLERFLSLLLPGGAAPGRYVSVLAAACIAGLLAGLIPRRGSGASRTLFMLAGSGLILASPLMLFYSLAGLTYMAEALGWLLLTILVSRRPELRGQIALAFLAGLLGGLRPTLLVWALALSAIEAMRERRWIRARALPWLGVAMALGVAIWFLPLLLETGGWTRYAAITARLTRNTLWSRSVFVLGVGNLLRERLPWMLRDLWIGLGPGVLLPSAALILRFRPRRDPAMRRWDALWIGALLSFAFYFLLIYDTPGYLVAFALVIMAYGILVLSQAILEASRRRQFPLALMVLLLVISPVGMPQTLQSKEHLGIQEYRRHDRELQARFAAVRAQFSPDSTVLVTSEEYWSFGLRHVMYYLPEYTVLQLTPDPCWLDTTPATPYLTARDNRVWTSGPDESDLATLAGFRSSDQLRQVVYMIPLDAKEFIGMSCRDRTRALPVEGGEVLPVIAVTEEQRVRVRQGRLECGGGAVR